MPRLWITDLDVPALRHTAGRGWPRTVARAAAAFTTSPPAPGDPPGSPAWIRRCGTLAECAALCHTLDSVPEAAATALRAALDLTAAPPRSDLSRAAILQQAVIAYDLCSAAWSRTDRTTLGSRIAALATALAGPDLSKDNPDNPFNNWWAVTHAASALGALCLAPGNSAMGALHASARARVRSCLTNFGDHGHYYEGTGYGFYALSHLAPYILAERHASGSDPADLAPGIARVASLVHALTVPRPRVADSDEPVSGLGMRVSWNDDGGQWPGNGVPSLLLALAPIAQQVPLRRLHDRLCGPRGDRSAAIPAPGILWTFLYYPEARPNGSSTPPWRPPLFVSDQRSGLVAFRNRYRDGDDCVVAAYAKSYHGGGHTHEDLGSWRFQGLGHGWARAGGQAKTAAPFQCVVTRDGLPNRGRHGQVSFLAPGRDGTGGSVSLRLGPAAGTRIWDRHLAIDFTGAAGVPALVALLDQCSHPEAGTWEWTLCFENHLAFEPLSDGPGFDLRAPARGPTLRVRFISPLTAAPEVVDGPASERTFSNGTRRTYPGARYVRVRAAGESATFFAIATLQPHRTAAPRLSWEGSGDDAVISVGRASIQLRKGRWFHGPLAILPG